MTNCKKTFTKKGTCWCCGQLILGQLHLLPPDLLGKYLEKTLHLLVICATLRHQLFLASCYLPVWGELLHPESTIVLFLDISAESTFLFFLGRVAPGCGGGVLGVKVYTLRSIHQDRMYTWFLKMYSCEVLGILACTHKFTSHVYMSPILKIFRKFWKKLFLKKSEKFWKKIFMKNSAHRFIIYTLYIYIP